MVKALYVHIPFCSERCPYCDFVSFTLKGADLRRYVDLVLREAELYRDLPLRIETVYLGGGTPSLLPPRDIARLLEGLCSVLKADPVEVTVECNPESYGYREFRELLKAGVNRVSIGVQSFTRKGLEVLGRKHRAESAVRSVTAAREAGIGNVSIDLIYGYPGQTTADLEEDLRAVEKLRPTHLSAYLLTLHRGTPLEREVRGGRLRLPDEEELHRIHSTLLTVLREMGYRRYEISSWALPGYECRHNLVYWRMEEFLGLGVSAWGFYEGRRYANLRDPRAYARSVMEGKRPVERELTLSEEEREEETLMLGLRLREGLPKESWGLIPPELRLFFEEGERGIGIREEYMLLSDEIIAEVLLYNSHRKVRR